MQLQYGQIVQYIPDLLAGAVIALEIAVIAFVLGALMGLFGAAVLTYGNKPSRMLVRMYVSFFTNTPQLVQIFFLFFALPEFGILLSPIRRSFLA